MDQFNRPPQTYAPVSGYSNNVLYPQQPTMMTPNYNNVYIAPPPMMMSPPMMMGGPPPIISSQPFMGPPPIISSQPFMGPTPPYVSSQPFMGPPQLGYPTPTSSGYGVTPNLNIPFSANNYY